MSNRILVALDGSDYSRRGIELALKLAAKDGSTVVGLAVVDEPGIEHDAAGAGVGAAYYALKQEERELTEAERKVKSFLEGFQQQCEKQNVSFETLVRYGDPAEEILQETTLVELLILGLRSYFHFVTSDEPDDTFEKVVQECRCPTLGVPAEPVNLPVKVLLAYDGSLKARNTMRVFGCLNSHFQFDASPQVLTVTDDPASGKKITAEADRYLRAHGLEVEVLIRTGRPRDVIFTTVQELHNHGGAMLLIGTNGRDHVTDYLFGNSLKRLLEDGSIPLFIYH